MCAGTDAVPYKIGSVVSDTFKDPATGAEKNMAAQPTAALEPEGNIKTTTPVSLPMKEFSCPPQRIPLEGCSKAGQIPRHSRVAHTLRNPGLRVGNSDIQAKLGHSGDLGQR